MVHQIQKKLKCTIKDIRRDVKSEGCRNIVSIEFDDQSGKPTWFQAFSIDPETVTTIDQLLDFLSQMNIKRPEISVGKDFELDLTGKFEK